MKEKAQIDPIGELASASFYVGGLSIFASPCVLAYQVYKWLVAGEWTALSLMTVFDHFQIACPKFNWLGVQKIANWFFNAPLTLVLLLGGVGFVVLGLQLLDVNERKQKKGLSTLRH